MHLLSGGVEKLQTSTHINDPPERFTRAGVSTLECFIRFQFPLKFVCRRQRLDKFEGATRSFRLRLLFRNKYSAKLEASPEFI
jgi:hypothetical protein